MSDRTLWIIPEAPAPGDANITAQRRTQGGLRLGILDNSKSNADHLLRMIVEDIKAQVPVASVMALRKPSPAAGAEAKLLEQLAQEADCVITAMAD
jgi:hypothetical protein